jgi:predicted MFS family arabinose efflux permease
MQVVAQGWLVVRLTDSNLMLGALGFATYLPIAFGSLFAGVLADRIDRRSIMLTGNVLFMISPLALSWLTWTGRIRIGEILFFAVCTGIIAAVEIPAHFAFVSDMIGGEVADLPDATALDATIFNGSKAVGPALAGVLIGVIHEEGCFLINALTFIPVVISLLSMDLPRQAPARPPVSVFDSIREAFTYSWGHANTKYLLIALIAVNGIAIQYSVLLPFFARNLLNVGPAGYGLLQAAQGIGALGGMLFVTTRKPSVQSLSRNLIAGLLILGLSIVMFAIARGFIVSLSTQIVAGAGILTFAALTNSLIQMFVPAELRGRVMSIYVLASMGFVPVGSIGIGAMAQGLSAEVATLLAGGIAIAVAVVLFTQIGVGEKETDLSGR